MSTSSTAPITVKENGVSSAKDTILLVIGAAEPIPWPPRLPDFTLCDFYPWRYAEDQYTNHRCHSHFESEFRIANVDEARLRSSGKEFEITLAFAE
jgi:hypothetical protein